MKVLDLYCCAGGATKGLQLAGFHVTGVDIRPQENYCGDTFIQDDALAVPLKGYDFIWASPPCQKHSRLTPDPSQHDDLIGPTRQRLLASGIPWCIENVQGAPLHHTIMLCGSMFGLKVYRHRYFECSWFMFQPEHSKHRERCPGAGRPPSQTGLMSIAGHFPFLDAARRAMGIDWMNREELSQAIPPAYSEFIARQFLAQKAEAA